ncbi:MAG: hypothetical protein EOP56_08380 [Sphingobacteriales bacterium]|nr:MAG: hypothetical protein EOP56_08380 [Sphingobacteriales bacterium]
MKKITALVLIVIVASLIGGAYGILHDQLTYTISPEYYTKFKFYQFRLAGNGKEAIFPHPRLQVSAVGLMATWWMGASIGLILGIVGLLHQNGRQMFLVTVRAFIIAVVVTFLTGLVGLAYGKLVLESHKVNWWLPDNLIDKDSFIAVGSMHNFSYLGGIFGLIAAIIFSIMQWRRYS